ncbi:hypothetical protein [Aeoliella mucimassa]|uniref:PEP-CTERM protein-sorting domain-containing protein n=1 Tax=Aeoliella mucimassa TaxID=2527972 RepID=A0A518ASJ7_9BACT|nr:hypothetical protein [Aeoliella mucimassa]QDU57657.1 hypothetical protein Pan181_38770 [Aeoliella mucimassa]
MFRLLILFLFGSQSILQSASAQSQLQFNLLSDFGDGTTQTFVSESNDTILAVRLVVFGHGNAADTTVEIRDLLPDGTLDSEILTSGMLLASDVPIDAPDWRTVVFDDPFEFTLNEDYGLVVNQFGSGPTGYNDYGAFIDGRETGYQGGSLQFPLYPGDQLKEYRPSGDLAFSFVVPEPSSAVLIVLFSAPTLVGCLFRGPRV